MVAVWGRLRCRLVPGAAGWLSLLSHPCHLLGRERHVPWSLPRLRGCVWPSLENRFPARGREEGTDEGVVEVKRQTACRPGEICGDIPCGMNLGGQQDLCFDLCAFWGTSLPWRWLARARRCSPSPCSLLVAFSIGFVPTDAARGDPRGEEGGGRPAPFLLLLLPAHLPPRCSNNNRRAPGAELEGVSGYTAAGQGPCLFLAAAAGRFLDHRAAGRAHPGVGTTCGEGAAGGAGLKL